VTSFAFPIFSPHPKTQVKQVDLIEKRKSMQRSSVETLCARVIIHERNNHTKVVNSGGDWESLDFVLRTDAEAREQTKSCLLSQLCLQPTDKNFQIFSQIVVVSVDLISDVLNPTGEAIFHFYQRWSQYFIVSTTLSRPKHPDSVRSALPIFGVALPIYGNVVGVESLKVIRSDKHLFKFDLLTLRRMLRDPLFDHRHNVLAETVDFRTLSNFRVFRWPKFSVGLNAVTTVTCRLKSNEAIAFAIHIKSVCPYFGNEVTITLDQRQQRLKKPKGKRLLETIVQQTRWVQVVRHVRSPLPNKASERDLSRR
jgi:hypothetical protein